MSALHRCAWRAAFLTIVALVAFPARSSAFFYASPELVAHIVGRILLPGAGERYSSVAVNADGDALIGVSTWFSKGRILRVSRRAPTLTSRDTPRPPGPIVMTSDGRTCSPTSLSEIVCTSRNRGTQHLRLPNADGYDVLIASGVALVTFDHRSGNVFRLAGSNAQPLQPGFTVLAVAADDRSIALVGAEQRCFFDAASGLRRRCSPMTGLGRFGPGDIAAVAADTTYVLHVGERGIVVVPARGAAYSLALPFVPQRLVARDRASVWVAGSAGAGQLAIVAMSGSKVIPLRLRAGLTGGALLAPDGSTRLVVVDQTLRVALFLDVERR